MSNLLPQLGLRCAWPKVSRPRYLRQFRGFSSAAPSSALVQANFTYPPQPLTYISPRPSSPPPTDPSVAHITRLELELQSLPILVSHRSKTDASEWYETRPYRDLPEDRRTNNLTAGALRGSGKLALAPLVRVRKDETESLVVVHVGKGLCGHDGIVHGGLLATLLDEGMGRTAINSLPGKFGFTANLSLNYRAPTKADQFILLKTKLANLSGRKVWVDGLVEDTNGNILADAKTMWIQPKYAEFMDTKSLSQTMGEREVQPEPWAP